MLKPGFSRFVDLAVGKPMSNDQLPIRFARIQERTGICSRMIADERDTISSIAERAGEKLFETLNISGKDCGGLVLASCSGDARDRHNLKEAARVVATSLGISLEHVQAVDYACSGFPKAVETCLDITQTTDRHVLLVAAEIMSRIVHWGEESAAVLFGDRAAATSIIGGGHEILDAAAWEVDDPHGWIHLDHLQNSIDTNGESHPQDCIRMNGPALYRHAPSAMVTLAEDTARRMAIPWADISAIIPHHANGRFMEKMGGLLRKKIGSEAEHIWIVNEMRHVGNVAACSVPSALASVQDNLLPGKIVICPTIGAGPAFKRGLLTEGIVSFRVSQ